MNINRIVRHHVAVMLILGGSITLSGASAADHLDNDDISRVWSRLDHPVLSGAAARTWFWGPEPISELLEEPYEQAPGGKRQVIYFDKTRMEINANAEPGSTWRITNGLLATELITGQVQLGDEAFVDVDPAEINVAGDPDDSNGPTYRSLRDVMDDEALPEGTLITHSISRDSSVRTDSSYGDYQVTAGRHVPETDHTVASVFWEYINSSGTIYQDGSYLFGPLFENLVYGVGYPITEAYWTTVRVAGEKKPVLIQAFQRRVLTYTPNNPDGWKVESGNVGRHYRDWRAALGDIENPEVNDESPVEDSDSGSTNQQSPDCDERSANMSENGTVNQSNSATINQNGGENQTVTCTQKNTSVQKP